MKWIIYLTNFNAYYRAWGESDDIVRIQTAKESSEAFQFDDRDEARARVRFLRERQFRAQLQSI